jgi:hypothetical protein
LVAVIARRADSLHRFVGACRRLARLPPPVPPPVSLGTLLAEAARVFESHWAARPATRSISVSSIEPRISRRTVSTWPSGLASVTG